ncbi:MAG TPA: hypothetical protein VMG37_10910 [Solirubrobacteraceae bacterium]|nr:hypothetical protein [Solirubrobacteraceae bacterium]
MPATAPRDSVIATVGDGFGSLLVHTTARYLGFENEQLTVFGPSDNPVGTYQQFAYNLGQTVLRSESESHFLAPDWPTFAQLDAWSHKSLKPLWRTTRRKYNPGVPEILTEAAVVTRRTGWDQARIPTRVGWLQRQMQPTPHFVMYDEQANFIGRAKHVMLAPGHGPLSFPPLLAKARKDPALADRIVQAYEPKQYAAGGRYIVLGAGIASVNEWANVLDAGGSVLALTRNEQPETQDLNVPRCLFESIGIDAYTRLPFDQRIEFLGQVLRGTRPERKQWLARIQDGQKEGRFDALVGEIDKIEPGRAGLRVYVKSKSGEDPGWLDVTGVTAGTGFNKSVLTLPLIRRLVEFYKVPVVEGRLRLQTNCGVPGLDLPESRLCCMGLIANNVIPHGDTIAGLKFIARRFVTDCARAEKLQKRSFPSRMNLQFSMGRDVAEALRTVSPTEQLA